MQLCGPAGFPFDHLFANNKISPLLATFGGLLGVNYKFYPTDHERY